MGGTSRASLCRRHRYSSICKARFKVDIPYASALPPGRGSVLPPSFRTHGWEGERGTLALGNRRVDSIAPFWGRACGPFIRMSRGQYVQVCYDERKVKQGTKRRENAEAFLPATVRAARTVRVRRVKQIENLLNKGLGAGRRARDWSGHLIVMSHKPLPSVPTTRNSGPGTARASLPFEPIRMTFRKFPGNPQTRRHVELTVSHGAHCLRQRAHLPTHSLYFIYNIYIIGELLMSRIQIWQWNIILINSNCAAARVFYFQKNRDINLKQLYKLMGIFG